MIRESILSIVCFVFIQALASAQNINKKKIFTDAQAQATVLLKESREARTGKAVFPRTLSNDSLKLVGSGDWTSGFWPGILWFLYEYSGKAEWRSAAQEFTALMVKEPTNRGSHDVGFKVYDSYGNGYRLTKDSTYRQAILQGAKTLSTRFNSKVGCIKSWDFPQYHYPVIIDNMMNLELLFAATRLSGDSSFYKIAVTHANTTLKNHFRDDNSSVHVVDYDSATGNVIAKKTHQGYADGSAWARGQAWALYGYTMCYRETKNKEYLQQAERVATYIINNPDLPADGVPYWDYNVTDKKAEPRDASAASIVASALYELSSYSKKGSSYRKMADKILKSLTDHYRAAPGSHHGFILLHSTGHKPAGGEVDVPIIYADYYYLEALMRKDKKW